jgi:hypothetical protein
MHDLNDTTKRTLLPWPTHLAESEGKKVNVTNDMSQTTYLGSWVGVKGYGKIEKPNLIHSNT